MNTEQVQRILRSKYAAHGPWLHEVQVEHVETNRVSGLERRTIVWERTIGFYRNDSGKVVKLEVANAETWEEALAQVEDWWAKQVPRKVHHASVQERAEKAGGLPMAGDLFETPQKLADWRPS